MVAEAIDLINQATERVASMRAQQTRPQWPYSMSVAVSGTVAEHKIAEQMSSVLSVVIALNFRNVFHCDISLKKCVNVVS